MGGNRSGKTEIEVVSMVKQIRGELPSRPLAVRVGGWQLYFISQTQEKQREVVQLKIDNWLAKNMIRLKPNGEPMIYSTRGIWDFVQFVDPKLNDPYLKKHKKKSLHGATLYFKSYEEGVLAFESSSIDAIYADEEPPEPIYRACMARLLDRKRAGNGYWMCAMTPDDEKGMTWTHEKIIEPDEMGTGDPAISVFRMNTYENKENLGEEEVKELEKKYGETTAKARIYGFHTSREGFILDKFRPEKWPNGNIIPHFYPDWRFYTPYESTDWGYKHAWHWGFYAISRDGEYIKYDEIHVHQHTIPMMKRLLYFKRKMYGYKQPLICIADPNVNRPNPDGSSVNTLLAAGMDLSDDGTGRTEYELGRNVWIGEGEPPANRNHKDYIVYPVIVSLANNDREQGWKLLNERMDFTPPEGRPSWFVTENCVNTIRETKYLQYPPDTNKRIHKQKEIARKRNDDSCDADRYASNANFLYIEDYDPNEDWFMGEDMIQMFKDQKRKKDKEESNVDSLTGW